jgi:hypothetical protein
MGNNDSIYTKFDKMAAKNAKLEGQINVLEEESKQISTINKAMLRKMKNDNELELSTTKKFYENQLKEKDKLIEKLTEENARLLATLEKRQTS